MNKRQHERDPEGGQASTGGHSADPLYRYLDRLWRRGREFLNVRYPIMGGAMTWISEAGLVSAISNAGGFGVLAGGNMPIERFRDEITRTSDLTDRPFGVNMITIAPNFKDHLKHALKVRFPYVILAGGLPPRTAITHLRQEGCRVICFAPTVGVARSMISLGADALILEGNEAGGHIGPVSTAVLAEEILPTTRAVPVFVAGGIASGLLMVHYLMMGASGVQLGTRFAVSTESPAHPNFKKALIRASARDAMPTAQFDPRVRVIPVRALANEGTRDFTTLQLGLVAQIERGEVAPEEATMRLEEFWIGALRRAAVEGDISRGSLMAGQSVGLVRKVEPVAEIIDDLIAVALAEIRKHRKTFGD